MDIETTSLSLYYDHITVIGWSKLNNYNAYVTQGDPAVLTQFLLDLNDAKCMVTFNGSMYDVPFLKKAFPEIKFPKCHIDLQFFAKPNLNGKPATF